MSVIYEPRGKAREYSELALNLYTGCVHKCSYCYCPAILRKDLNSWANNPKARTNILKQVEKDAAKMFRCEKELLLSFMSDVYMNDEAAYITRKALLILEKYEFKKVTILTKAGFRAVNDFDIIKRNNWKFGSTIIFRTEDNRKKYEEGAPSIESRYQAVIDAKKDGIYTWVSVEPVIDPEDALNVIRDLKKYVDFWKVGKLNHNKALETTVDWRKFYYDVVEVLGNSKYMIKMDFFTYAK